MRDKLALALVVLWCLTVAGVVVSVFVAGLSEDAVQRIWDRV